MSLLQELAAARSSLAVYLTGHCNQMLSRLDCLLFQAGKVGVRPATLSPGNVCQLAGPECMCVTLLGPTSRVKEVR